ncbi:hypothetical protein SK854_00920 [Lentzea sp. BCCO 10_0061]|uniref:SMI1/KNR4 family protein n=1 Tax=Lentzea sokolovensis TaxID=3095429 RepID=A0ABU4UPC2_9PSEU|nr:hypothetical protein [Lentzea sp. BCCO 10_0061]MDX8140656.1 hypothetical protein [Lentzea sp. BCCO 10_0061]
MSFDNGAALGAAAADFLRRHLIRPGVRDGVALEPGLTDAEFAEVEEGLGFEFADDHRALLAEVLPTGSSWMDWRSENLDVLRRQCDWPVRGVLFDVENSDFWHESWGVRPSDVAEAVECAKEHLATVPRMIPVFSHRCLPAGRGTFGNPVLSMHQTDIIYYGFDLLDYVAAEFYIRDPQRPWRTPKPIAFWDDLL